MNSDRRHRLEGLEPDNLLAFLALLGLLCALEAEDRKRLTEERLYPRIYWEPDAQPLRPLLALKIPLTRTALLEALSRGIHILLASYDFGGRKDLNYSRVESRAILEQAAQSSREADRQRIDLLAALMSDGAIKDKEKQGIIDPTPLCLLLGQGHQHFLDRLAAVPHQLAPPRKRGAPALSEISCLDAALFDPWHREDETFSFRWDPAEDVRYALRAGDPTDSAYKTGTQHGANRLAAIGLRGLTLVPEIRAGRVRPAVLGGGSGADGFSFSWPIWREPASLAAIRAMLSHPDLRNPPRLAYLGVEHVMTARRISVGKFMNFTRARANSDSGST